MNHNIVYNTLVYITIITCVYIINNNDIIPQLRIYDPHHGTYTYYSHYFDHRLIRTVINNIGSLQNALPEEIPHRYESTRMSYKRDIEQNLESIRTHIANSDYNRINKIGNIIKDDNFNYTSGTGLLVIRLHQHPFVIKLFTETGESITRSHGIEPFFFMRMNGGIARHIAGLTRITVNQKLLTFLYNHADQYANITTPRTWAWVPDDTPWLDIHLTINTQQSDARVPGIYALINDAIEYDRTAHIPSDMVFSLFRDTNNIFDPHEGNCVYETQFQQYVILDTESFVDIVGLDRPLRTRSYVSWYGYLCYRFLIRALFPQLTRPA